MLRIAEVVLAPARVLPRASPTGLSLACLCLEDPGCMASCSVSRQQSARPCGVFYAESAVSECNNEASNFPIRNLREGQVSVGWSRVM